MSLVGKATLLAAIFLFVPAILYDQFRAADQTARKIGAEIRAPYHGKKISDQQHRLQHARRWDRAGHAPAPLALLGAHGEADFAGARMRVGDRRSEEKQADDVAVTLIA